MADTIGDYTDSLNTELVNANYQLGSDAISQAADNSGNTGAISGIAGANEHVFDPTYGGTLSAVNQPTDFSKALGAAKQFISQNKGLITAAGALAAANSSPTIDKKTGYQGGIPLLQASRSMYTRPPTKEQGYRPGAGGIDYGGDVTYTRMADGTDPWSGLSGTSGSTSGANLTTPDATGGISNLAKAANAGSVGYQNFIKSGGTPEGYLKTINDWLKANPNVTNAELQAIMSKFGVSQTDLQTALGAGNYSAAEKYALTHGMGSAGVNQSINDWLAKFPNATAQQISDAMKSVGMNMADVQDALAANKNISAADRWNILNNHSPAEVNSAINNWLALHPNATAEEKKTAADAVGISQQDIAEAEALPLQNKAAAIAAKQPVATEENIYDLFKGGANPSTVANAVASSGLSTADLAKEFNLKAEDLSWLRGQGYLPPGYAEGGMAQGRYLQGETDGMADELPAKIGTDEPAALSHGEFVIPADVVSHLGNGNSDAGAKKLYQMMDKIRMARTGTKKQGKRINPDKFMPGGLAQAYAKGGKVKKFEVGGSTGTAGTNYGAGIQGIESNLSNWAGPYVTNMLGQGQALANMPYAAYMGPLTAGESPLQTTAFKSAAGLTTPASIGQAATTAGDIATTAKGLTYQPTTTSFDATQAQQYMNPYIQTALQPQLEEARRQSQITQQQNAAKMTQAGAFGGGRQAILDAETQRALGANLANITGQGYSTAYDKAMAQFNADQARKAQEAQFGATYGLQGLQTGLQGAQVQGALGTQEQQAGLNNLNAMLAAGAQQRGIESEGIAADKAQFEEARANPYKMVQFQQSLLQGLPLAAQSYQGIEPSTLVKAAQGATTVNALLKNLGLIS